MAMTARDVLHNADLYRAAHPHYGRPVELFEHCPLPGCQNLVEDPRDPCGECKAAFGDQLRDSGQEAPPAEVFAAEMAGRDEAVRAVLAERRQPAGPEPERKRNQICWVCEDRRACRRDPDHPERWICKDCEAL